MTNTTLFTPPKILLSKTFQNGYSHGYGRKKPTQEKRSFNPKHYFEAFLHLGRTALNLKKDKQRPRFFDFRSLYENSYYQMKQSNFFKDLIWSPNQNEWSYQIKWFKEYSEKILSDLTEQ